MDASNPQVFFCRKCGSQFPEMGDFMLLEDAPAPIANGLIKPANVLAGRQ